MRLWSAIQMSHASRLALLQIFPSKLSNGFACFESHLKSVFLKVFISVRTRKTLITRQGKADRGFEMGSDVIRHRNMSIRWFLCCPIKAPKIWTTFISLINSGRQLLAVHYISISWNLKIGHYCGVWAGCSFAYGIFTSETAKISCHKTLPCLFV